MDFKDLLDIAKLNEKNTKKDNSFKFSTKISSAKKLSKPGPNVSAIQNHLKKLDDEKKKKEEKFNKEKNNLLTMRANSKHSTKRVRSLINRTKGASKAVLDDAKDLTTAKGEAQCDEDDYGYESTLSQQIFSKLQNVYSELPEDERLNFKKTEKSSIEDIKNRVMSSLKKKQEEELGIRKRKRNRKSKSMKDGDEDDGFINDGDVYKKFVAKDNAENNEIERKSSKKKRSKHDIDPSLLPSKTDKYASFKYDKDKRKDEKKEKTIEKEKEKEKEKKKITKSAKPPLKFEDLMKLASNKQKNPSPIIDPLQELLEKREKLKQQSDETRLLTAKEKKELEEEKLSKLRKVGKSSASKDAPVQKESKKDLKSNEDKAIKGNKDKVSKESKSVSEVPKKVSDKSKYFAVPKPMPDKSKCLAAPSKSPSDNPPRNIPPSVAKSSTKVKIEKEPPAKSKPPLPELKKKLSRDSPPPRSFSKPSHLSLPRKPARPGPPKSFKRRIDSDEEYDSEMDDFIDDGDVDIDYSSAIKQIFKYDKSRYVDDDDDVDNMEASYSQVEKEEVHSARIGLMEDLEDIKREEEEKKRKKMLMKKRKLQ